MDEQLLSLARVCVPAVVIVLVAWAVYRNRTIDCPECLGGERRPPGPCPTCGPEGEIHIGSNPEPRGTGHGSAHGPNAARAASHGLDRRGRRK